ncbi:TolC family protein [Noviherbaspirillum pedocola]|uniref:TolC family protein n=1 Tax=Noviherbaspirillum pedocola TaxID=2801341 RepID=A0A934W714_9BURK|nr:TolC family protein [Noviherbaspirillum pedocola]MBK4735028.1 TolC family protein [Noviherbaspirillum pedocola]
MKRFRSRIALAVLLLPCLARATEADMPYPQALPPVEQARRALARQPLVAAARAGVAQEEAGRTALLAGSNEWTVRATSQRRNVINDRNYQENGIALERPLRLPSKAGKDAQLGDGGVRLAELRLADAWHEAARALMKSWFDWLREARAATRLEQNAQLLDRQLQIVNQRVRAGDAPRMEIALAQTERDRAQAAAMAAAQRRALLEAAIAGRYPELAATPPEALPEPASLAASPQAWRERILADNHELEVAQAEAAQARLAAERTALDGKPDPTLGVHYIEERGRQERILGMSLSFAIPGAARGAQARAGWSRAAQAEERAQEARMKVETEAMAGALRAASTQALWQQLAAIACQAEDYAGLAARAYALGELPLNDTLLARRQALDALTNAEQAQIDALEAQARLLLDAHRIWSLEDMEDAKEVKPQAVPGAQ